MIVAFYPTRLSDTALRRLSVFARQNVGRMSWHAGAWLSDVAERELERRERAKVGEVLEVALPEVQPSQLSDEDVADAMMALAMARKSVVDPEAAALVDAMFNVTITLAAVRLRRREQGTPSSFRFGQVEHV